MGMDNYRVEYENGTEEFFQFDESEDAGKAGLKALKDAAKSDDSPVKSVTKADPPKSSVGQEGVK